MLAGSLCMAPCRCGSRPGNINKDVTNKKIKREIPRKYPGHRSIFRFCGTWTRYRVRQNPRSQGRNMAPNTVRIAFVSKKTTNKLLFFQQILIFVLFLYQFWPKLLWFDSSSYSIGAINEGGNRGLIPLFIVRIDF